MARCPIQCQTSLRKRVTSNPLLDIHDVSTAICLFRWRHAVLCPPFRWWWLSSDSAYFCLLLAFSMCILLYCHIMFMIHEYVQFVFSPSASFVSPFASFVQAASHHFGVFSWCIPPGFHRFPMGFPGHLLLHLLWIAPVVCYGRLKLGRGIGKMGTRTRTRVG